MTSRAAGPGLRADIVDAATRVFSRQGYHAASMASIADEVGMRKASLYHHVRRKEDLLFAIHEQLLDELVDATLGVLSSSQSAADKLRGVLRVNMALLCRRRDGVKVLLRERPEARDGDRWAELIVKRDFYEQMVRRVIAEGVSSRRFVDLPADIAAHAVLAMANWSSTWYDPKGKLSSDEVSDIFADIVLEGLLSR